MTPESQRRQYCTLVTRGSLISNVSGYRARAIKGAALVGTHQLVCDPMKEVFGGKGLIQHKMD